MADSPTGELQVSGDLANTLLGTLSAMVARALGSQPIDKNGKPLREVCYMQLPQGVAVDPRSFANPWSPNGSDTIADTTANGKLVTVPVVPTIPVGTGTAASGATTTVSGGAVVAAGDSPAIQQLKRSLHSAYMTAAEFDPLIHVTDDGNYIPYQGSQTISSAYQAIALKAQGIPAPPLPADIQAKVDAARRVLWSVDANGHLKGQTPNYVQYQTLMLAYAQAKKDFGDAEARAMTDPNAGDSWVSGGSSLNQAKVDIAWSNWRSVSDEIETALDTLNAVGGSIGAFFVGETRDLFDKWGLDLTGAVAVKTPYTFVQPETWYDPTDNMNGFETLTVTSSDFHDHGSSSSFDTASSWYHGNSSSTSGGGAGMLFGITFGGGGGKSSSDSGSTNDALHGQSSSFGATMSNASITIEWALCQIFRPWLLAELFNIDGWYLPNEDKSVISDGTVAGQKGQADQHYLPMVPTQFLVIRNVVIEADGWGASGDSMSSWCQHADATSSSSGWNATGGIGFMGFGGTVSKSNADWSGVDHESDSAAGSWHFDGDSQHGVLRINGCQIAGYVGDILPPSPQVDGKNPPKVTGSTTGTAGTAGTASISSPTPAPAGTAGARPTNSVAATSSTPA